MSSGSARNRTSGVLAQQARPADGLTCAKTKPARTAAGCTVSLLSADAHEGSKGIDAAGDASGRQRSLLWSYAPTVVWFAAVNRGCGLRPCGPRTEMRGEAARSAVGDAPRGALGRPGSALLARREPQGSVCCTGVGPKRALAPARGGAPMCVGMRAGPSAE
ncbi:hypothetical protein CERSUDRAFT_82363 [Gelatoporia subvermispora B]|uniref:Uncharacterized protein n=1 Tax=Ceriporiopsis subvermispora (strain B) TaxID=914234 RepID=M2PNV3_CERS8|nr:hypothetical protein CERSUDRAFT_82363 [Gelatoporia subvermispora B]